MGPATNRNVSTAISRAPPVLRGRDDRAVSPDTDFSFDFQDLLLKPVRP
jgi:hypothetical protein